MPNETQQFLDEFKKPEESNDPFAFLEKPVEKPAEEIKGEETPEQGAPEPRNRREKRLMEKLQSERETAIALAAKLDAITQSQTTRSESAEWEKSIERIYGDSTPELREATELLKSSVRGAKEEAKREALAEFQQIRQQEQQAVSKAESRIDSMLEEIEDDYNVDLSSGAHQTEFLKLIEKMSPKDSNGNIVEYADHHAVWEIYQEKVNRNKPVNPAKDIVARGMTQSAGANDTNLSNDAHVRFLKEHGII
jgi:hypothetical protein